MFEVIRFDENGDYLGIYAICELKVEADIIRNSLSLNDDLSGRFEVRDAVTNGFSIPRMLNRIGEDICCNYCKYHDGVRVGRCDYTDKGGICPLEQLNW